jgi:excisionase family DNA binding protein
MKKGKRKKPALSDEPQSEMMTVYEVAQYLHCHYISVYRLIRQKAFPGFRLNRGGDWRFFRSEIDQWIAARLRTKKISAPAKPAAAPADEIMTVSTLALYLRCTQTTIYRLIKNNKIPAFKLGTDWRFFRSDIDEWIAGQQYTILPLTPRGRKSKLS